MSSFVSAREAADICGVSEKTVRRWIATGHLKANKSGRAFRIPVSTLPPHTGHQRRTHADTGHTHAGHTPNAPQSSADMSALLMLITDLQQQLLAKAEAAAMWQARAQLLESQLALPAPSVPKRRLWPLFLFRPS